MGLITLAALALGKPFRWEDLVLMAPLVLEAWLWVNGWLDG